MPCGETSSNDSGDTGMAARSQRKINREKQHTSLPISRNAAYMNSGDAMIAGKDETKMKNENANTKPSAIETYRQRREDVARLLDILDMELTKLGERARAAPKDWGFAGSMDHVRSTLIGLVEGLSGIERSYIEETLAE
jgi:hypothetical protein